jgi:polo-like kinase 1
MPQQRTLLFIQTLNELLKRRKVLSEVEVRYYLQQLLLALSYLHNNQVIHRDLKLDNFFLGENLEVKVGDFGLAAKRNHKLRKTICGTPSYIAPEVLESRQGYSYEVDVWSLGVTTYLLLYGYYPFDHGDPRTVAARIASKTYLINPALSDIAKAFISKMLQIKPN